MILEPVKSVGKEPAGRAVWLCHLFLSLKAKKLERRLQFCWPGQPWEVAYPLGYSPVPKTEGQGCASESGRDDQCDCVIAGGSDHLSEPPLPQPQTQPVAHSTSPTEAEGICGDSECEGDLSVAKCWADGRY